MGGIVTGLNPLKFTVTIPYFLVASEASYLLNLICLFGLTIFERLRDLKSLNEHCSVSGVILRLNLFEKSGGAFNYL